MARPVSELEKQAWGMRFGLNPLRVARMRYCHAAQLSQCKSDEARRIVLGLSETGTPESFVDDLSVAIFRTYDFAREFAERTEKMTGDPVLINFSKFTGRWEVERWTGSKWVPA